MTGHRMDWAHQPDVYKRYPGASQTDLVPVDALNNDSLWGLLDPSFERNADGNPTLSDLSEILAMGSGITFSRKMQGTEYTFRSAASAGALYPIEIYVDVLNVEGVEPGLYHNNVRAFTLEKLKKNPSGSAGSESPVFILYLSGVFFRSAWKYRERAYRYILNDAGHVAANLVLSLRSKGLGGRLEYDFDDGEVNRFLGLKGDHEACLIRIPVFRGGFVRTNDSGRELWDCHDEAPSGITGAESAEIVYPEIVKIHGDGSATGKRGRNGGDHLCIPIAEKIRQWFELAESGAGGHEIQFGPAVAARRSRRNFVPQPLSPSLLFKLLGAVGRAHAVIERCSGMCSGLNVGFIVAHVEGMEPGFYVADFRSCRFGLGEKGNLAEVMAAFCLDQRWAGMAGIQFVMAGDPGRIDDLWGARGYRYAMINAGFLGQVVYLASTALMLGCCGVGAFYDPEVEDLIGMDGIFYVLPVGHVKSAF
jgi:SagB-type dehydrogenase family enzyme